MAVFDHQIAKFLNCNSQLSQDSSCTPLPGGLLGEGRAYWKHSYIKLKTISLNPSCWSEWRNILDEMSTSLPHPVVPSSCRVTSSSHPYQPPNVSMNLIFVFFLYTIIKLIYITTIYRAHESKEYLFLSFLPCQTGESRAGNLAWTCLEQQGRDPAPAGNGTNENWRKCLDKERLEQESRGNPKHPQIWSWAPASTRAAHSKQKCPWGYHI